MKTKFFVLTFTFVIGTFSFSMAQDGEQLFKSNCASCHSIGKGKVVGPDLKGIHSKRDEKWLTNWIKSSQKMIKDGDTIAVRIYAENNNVMMPDAFINDEQINSVLAFIKTKSEQPEVIVNNQTNKTNSTAANSQAPKTFDWARFSLAEYVLAAICFLLFAFILALTKSIKTLTTELSRYYDNQ